MGLFTIQNPMRKVKVKINGKAITANEGDSILEIATKNGIDIPALCYHPDLPVKANCRLCLVEIKGQNGLTQLVPQRLDKEWT